MNTPHKENGSEKKWFIERMVKEGTCFGLAIKEQLHHEQSDFQEIEIYASETFGNLMVLDGCIMVTERDHFIYHEMITHPALFTHQHPQRVVVIGGGDCGTLQQVLKHPNVTSATQVEIDRRVTELSERFFPELCTANHDPRAAFEFVDGVKWIADCEPNSLDVIIIDSTDPVGPAEALFGEAFYTSCFRALAEGGILVQQSESPLLHLDQIISPMHERLTKAGFVTPTTLPFPQVVYPSGWWSVTLAGKDLDTTQPRWVDAKHLPFNTEYYNADIHQGAMVMPEFMRKKLS